MKTLKFEKTETAIDRLAHWVFEVRFQHSLKDCPKVGHLGYANGMSWSEWLVVNMAIETLNRQGKSSPDYFTYTVDSSG